MVGLSDLDQRIADEAANSRFHRCVNPACKRWVTEKVAYCCASCEMGHALGEQISHDLHCHHRDVGYFRAWGSGTPPWRQQINENHKPE